jgi:hypothetical protein
MKIDENKLKDCLDADIKMPDDPTKSKSKKLIKIDGIWFFLQQTKYFNKIYEVSTKKFIMAPGDMSTGLNILVENIDKVKEKIEEFKNG